MDFSGNLLLLIQTEAQAGSRNMAVDEALLEAARFEGLAAVRFYRWAEPTLSLGYFQKSPPDDLPVELQTLETVRRLSGGGAILHHHEWTYSCVLPAGHALKEEPARLYDLVHEEMIAWFRRHDIPAALRGSSAGKQMEEPFLCFGREDPRDIVLGSHKIVGSAQRRRRGAVLQHGSVLLNRSPYAPMYPGLQDLANDPLPIDDWIEPLAKQIGERLQRIVWKTPGEKISVTSNLPSNLQEAATRLEREKYRSFTWR